jgi:hypothetical protein
MAEETKQGNLFIVDNRDEGWTALRYLEQWTEIATSFDIATGYFEIGALLALDGKWQGLEKIRILLGDETSARTKTAIAKAVREHTHAKLDASMEAEKDRNPFLTGVDAIVEAIQNGQIECRIYNRKKFHAKTFITHAQLEVVGSQALVGSSNFTHPGLCENIELNIRVQSAREVAQLQEWFEEHWDEAEEASSDILKTIERHVEAWTPFDVYTRALYEFFKGHEPTASEWDEGESKVYPLLDKYQQEAYNSLMKIALRHQGAFLCDGVGLGKTYVGLMLIERLVVREGKNVLLLSPKAAREGVWDPKIRELLPHLSGDFSNLAVFNHTDLTRKGDYPERFQRMAERADVVIIDEAHNFRNRGTQGNEEEGKDPSRYWRLFDLLDPEKRPKQLFMLTATPINNRLADFRHMIELFSREQQDYFASSVGVHNLTAHFNTMEKALRSTLGDDGTVVHEDIIRARAILEENELFHHIVVQRSRAYAKESQMRESKGAAVFPDRKPPQVAEYTIFSTYGALLTMLEEAFDKHHPLFHLPVYYPLHYYIGDDDEIDPFKENRQKAVVSLIRTNFLKRFESSVAAFEMSCDRILKKLLAFLEKNVEADDEKERLENWKTENGPVFDYTHKRQAELFPEDDIDEDDPEDDLIPAELLELFETLPRDEYDVEKIIEEIYEDLDQICAFLVETKKFDPAKDDKLKKLKRLLGTKDVKGKKILVFTEFTDTARYLRKELEAEGFAGVFQLDGQSSTNRAVVIRRFAPYYNGSSSADLVAEGEDEIQILISTDVLSEGLNLQDACLMINYDIHWNPVRLMQRIGRVDRRMDPEVEERLIADHPEVEKDRGKVQFWNFLPPAELNSLLTLFARVTHKTLCISTTLGIEGGKLLTPEDDYEALKAFNESYEGKRSIEEEMKLEFNELKDTDTDLAERLESMPGAIFSGRKKVARGIRGVFFCYQLPVYDEEIENFVVDGSHARWYLYDIDGDQVIEEAGNIVKYVRSTPETPRHCQMTEKSLFDIRKKVRDHIKNTWLKKIDAPLGVEPKLACWMELNEG